MAAETRNIAVVLKRPNRSPTPGQDPWALEHPSTYTTNSVCALYSKAVDIWLSPCGRRMSRNMLRFWAWNEPNHGFGFGPDDSEHNEHLELLNLFLHKISTTSPLLVVDPTFQRPNLAALPFLRGPWVGDFTDFNPRKQAILLNKLWVDKVVETAAMVEQVDTNENRIRWYVAQFRIVRTIVHELAHLLITYLGHGERDTPEKIRGRDGRGTSVEAHEAGEFFEQGVFGGLVEFLRDALFDEGEEEFPYVCVTQKDAWRVDRNSLVSLMQGPVPLDANCPVVMMTTHRLQEQHNRTARSNYVNQIGPGYGTVLRPNARGQSRQDTQNNVGEQEPGTDHLVNDLRQWSAGPSHRSESR